MKSISQINKEYRARRQKRYHNYFRALKALQEFAKHCETVALACDDEFNAARWREAGKISSTALLSETMELFDPMAMISDWVETCK